MINKSCLTEMVNFGFLLFSIFNIFKTPGWPCISDFSLLTPYFPINTHKTLKLLVLGNIETGILVDFIVITIFGQIGGHQGF